MSEEYLVKHCSPTLAGMKTGNLFGMSFVSKDEMTACIRCWNGTLTKKGLRALPLRFNSGKALIYVYRPERLKKDLSDGTAKMLLEKRGYPTEKSDLCVVQLRKRIGDSEEFPHEIGLFLGYPSEDVFGFIENRAGGFKYVGLWKVYGDVVSAQKTFSKYRKCTDIYCDRFSKGASIEKLTVSVAV